MNFYVHEPTILDFPMKTLEAATMDKPTRGLLIWYKDKR